MYKVSRRCRAQENQTKAARLELDLILLDDSAAGSPMQALIVYQACEPLLPCSPPFPRPLLRCPRPLQHFCHTIDDRSKAAPRGGGVTRRRRRRRCASDRLLSDDTKSLFGHWPGLAWLGLTWPGSALGFLRLRPSSPFYLLVKILRCRRCPCALPCVREVIKINLDQFGLLPNC